MNRMKFVCCVLVAVVLFSVVSAFSITSFAEISYDDLLEEKEQWLRERYERQMDGKYTWGEYHYVNMIIQANLTVLLYTDVADKITLEKWIDHGSSDAYGSINTWFSGVSQGEIYYLSSPELKEITKECYTVWTQGEHRSLLRECIQYYGITKSELLSAYENMRQDPDKIRSVLDFLTDEEYESAKNKDGTFGETSIPEFMLEALYMENDADAYRLLSMPYAVYIEEQGRMENGHDILTFSDLYENFSKLELTSDAIGDFLAYCKVYYVDYCQMDYAVERLTTLESAREAQLAAAKTGDSAVSALWVIALALPALTVVAMKRKRRI